MATERRNFSAGQRDDAFRFNAMENIGTVDGVMKDERFIAAFEAGQVFYCVACKFCHTDRAHFDVDHLVPDREFRLSANRSDVAANMDVLCKSGARGERGCNQVKGAKLWVPGGAGLAHTRPDIDMNCMPLHLRR